MSYLVVFGQDYAWVGLQQKDGAPRLVVRVLKDAPGAVAVGQWETGRRRASPYCPLFLVNQAITSASRADRSGR
jgi:hypothetical protein